MNNSSTTGATLAGAVIGAVVGYLFFSEQGRRVRQQIEPALDRVARELLSIRSTVQKASGVASEGWGLMNEILGETDSPPRYPGRQTSPF